MTVSLGSLKRYRKSYSRIKKIIDIPNLIDIQKRSYDRFLQADVNPDQREPTGLQGVFQSIFPIKDFSGTSSLEFVCYKLERPKYDVKECMQRGMTYAAPFKVVIRLVVWDTDDETGRQDVRDIKEQEVYFGDIPLMTDSGTFIVNGTERVIVSQLHRSPGVFFDHDKGRTHTSGKLLYNARIIPYRGSWLDFEFDTKDILHVRIDRRRKMPATILLKALGYTADEILRQYYERYYKTLSVTFLEGGRANLEFVPEWFQGQIASFDIVAGDQVFVKKNKRITQGSVMKMSRAGVSAVNLGDEDLIGMYLGDDVVDLSTGEIIGEISQEVTSDIIAAMRERGVSGIAVLHTGTQRISTSLRDTLLIDKVTSPLEAMIEIYKRLRPGDPPTVETATQLFNNLFFNAERYDLSRVGRVKMNYKLHLDADVEQKTLSREDIVAVVFYLLNLKEGIGDAEIDDIDHLGNRRVRAVGELVENQYRIGLVRMERAIRERMSLQEIDTLMPHDLINSKPVSAVIKEFFGSSQLSQFMDQTNPLSEVTHKRRLSALGPGGLTRERAGFEVRDVHNTHYGRICPVETPEGPNIGLIASLSTYARVNEYGFIETPYRPVNEQREVSNEALFLSALEEERYAIAQANVELDERNRFIHPNVSARNRGEFAIVPTDEVQYMDVSPNQLVSVAASLIPFLSHDDANRALMGANMQRQAVPLLKTAAPLIGTGMEAIVARDSGVTTVALRSGIVAGVDAERIVVKVNEAEHTAREAGVDIYRLIKYQRSNQNTCINQKPIVKLGEKVAAGDIIADGPSTDMGELALGQNITVAFMPWGGYNFEDSIVISEALIKDDRFTSVHIEVFECVSRDTKLGKEEITRDIPNVSEEMLANLDDAGIIRIGAEVKPGDILVGKISPKGETQLSPEEKLLRAIFGEKAGDVRDTSLTVPPGVYGTVLDAKVYSRKGVEKDQRALEIENAEIAKILKDQEEEVKIFRENALTTVKALVRGHKTTANLTSDWDGKVILKKGTELSDELLDQLDFSKIGELSLDDVEVEKRVSNLIGAVGTQIEEVKTHWQEKIDRVKRSDEMAPGVIKMVRVYVAIKRKLQVGDKLAGRHGNKGVLSRVVPEEDMPFLESGRPVEMMLNPLGVPSRMNVGQILETHLGRAALVLGEQIEAYIREHFSPKKIRETLLEVYGDDLKSLKPLRDQIKKSSDEEILNFARALSRGVHMAIPVFDGASEEDIKRALELAKVQLSGQATLFDGRNGDLISNEVTVGTMYMLKLHHLVDDKIHARSIGPYSLVTQQPLGGKAQFGGQRLGEMEVWAMEAYGAAFTLQEFLTVKSDDVAGRTRMYESIVKGEYTLEPGLPESFNVLVKELQSLSLDVTLLEESSESAEAAAEAAAAQAAPAASRPVTSAIDAAEALFTRAALTGEEEEPEEESDEEEASEDGDEEL